MILFVCATRKEMKFFLEGNLSVNPFRDSIPDQTFRNTRIGFLVCGVGPLNAAINLADHLVRKKVDSVVNVGIAGSYDMEALPLGAICVASQETWPEYGLKKSPYFSDPLGLGFALDKRGGDAVWNQLNLDNNLFRKKTGLDFAPGWHEGGSITVAGVSTDLNQASQLSRTFNAVMENMEGFALAYCCHLRSVPFSEIRSISNLAGSRNRKDWDLDKAFASLNTIWAGLWGPDGL